MDQGQLERLLENKIRESWGHEAFTASSLLDLLDLIKEGSKRMLGEDRVNDTDLQLAGENLSEFLGAMDYERARLGFAEFREETVAAARWRLCPGFWPFC